MQTFVVGILVALLIACSGNDAATQKPGRPSAAERRACAALRDVHTDIEIEAGTTAIGASLQRVASRANESDNRTLMARARDAREAFVNFLEVSSRSENSYAVDVSPTSDGFDVLNQLDHEHALQSQAAREARGDAWVTTEKAIRDLDSACEQVGMPIVTAAP